MQHVEPGTIPGRMVGAQRGALERSRSDLDALHALLAGLRLDDEPRRQAIELARRHVMDRESELAVVGPALSTGGRASPVVVDRDEWCWCVGIGDSFTPAPSRAAALREAIDAAAAHLNGPIRIAQTRWLTHGDFVRDHADAIIEAIGSRAYDEIGETFDYPDVSKEAEAALDAELARVIEAWLEEHVEEPRFFVAESEEEFSLGEEAEEELRRAEHAESGRGR